MRDVLVTVQALHPSAGLLKKTPLGHRETLLRRTHARAEAPHLPGLPPRTTKAARQAHGGLEASAGRTARSKRQSKLPAPETSCRTSSRRRANAVDTEDVARRMLERVREGLERLARNSREAAAREHCVPVGGAGMSLECRRRLGEEELKPCHLPLPALQKAKREAGALPRAIQAHVHCLPEARPGSSALGKARMLRDHGAGTTLPVTSRQLPGRSSFVPGAQTMPQRQMRGMPVYKEQDEAWPSCLTDARLRESPLRVSLSRTVQGLCQELVSKVLAARRDACAKIISSLVMAPPRATEGIFSIF